MNSKSIWRSVEIKIIGICLILIMAIAVIGIKSIETANAVENISDNPTPCKIDNYEFSDCYEVIGTTNDNLQSTAFINLDGRKLSQHEKSVLSQRFQRFLQTIPVGTIEEQKKYFIENIELGNFNIVGISFETPVADNLQPIAKDYTVLLIFKNGEQAVLNLNLGAAMARSEVEEYFSNMKDLAQFEVYSNVITQEFKTSNDDEKIQKLINNGDNHE